MNNTKLHKEEGVYKDKDEKHCVFKHDPSSNWRLRHVPIYCNIWKLIWCKRKGPWNVICKDVAKMINDYIHKPPFYYYCGNCEGKKYPIDTTHFFRCHICTRLIHEGGVNMRGRPCQPIKSFKCSCTKCNCPNKPCGWCAMEDYNYCSDCKKKSCKKCAEECDRGWIQFEQRCEFKNMLCLDTKNTGKLIN